MANTYTELKNRLLLLIDRDDATSQVAPDGTVVDQADVFIAHAEKRFYRSEAARIPPLEKTVQFSVASGTGVEELSIPTDYFESRYLVAEDEAGRSVTLARTSPEQLLNVATNASVSIPREFAYGSNKWLITKPNQTVTVDAIYYGFLDALSEQTTSTTDHYILNNLDDLIIYWAAVDAAMYYGLDPNLSTVWETRAQEIHDSVVKQEIRQQSSGSTPSQNRPYRSVNSRNYGYHF